MPLNRLAPLLAVIAALMALVTAAPSAADLCDERTVDVDAAFGGLPEYFAAAPICPADVGPGLAEPELLTPFSQVAAAEITQTDVWPTPTQHGQLLVAIVVGTLRSGSGEEFVRAYLQRLGPEAPQGTVLLDGRVVQYVNLPNGPRGYVYARGSRVVIGYVRAPVGTASHDIAAAQARQVYTRVLAAAVDGIILPGLPPPEDGLDQWPLARGNYTSAADPGWIFFRTPTEKAGITSYFCGIAPGGAVAGCDHTPDDAPDDTDQTIVDSAGARYIASDTTTFTRDVDTLRAGERLDNGQATCGVTYQGPVTCRIGEHKFVLNQYGVLE